MIPSTPSSAPGAKQIPFFKGILFVSQWINVYSKSYLNVVEFMYLKIHSRVVQNFEVYGGMVMAEIRNTKGRKGLRVLLAIVIVIAAVGIGFTIWAYTPPKVMSDVNQYLSSSVNVSC